MKTNTLTNPCNQPGTCTAEHHLVQHLAYPLTLGINLSFVYGLYVSGMEVETLFFIGFFVTLISLAILEQLLPYRKDWQANKRDWAINGIYFLINGAVDNAAKIMVAAIAIYLAPATSVESPWLFIGSSVLALLIHDFFSYWWHRVGHLSTLVWRFHGIHHMPKKLFMFNNNTVHFGDLFIGSLISGIPLLLMGFSQETIALTLYIASFHSFYAHINADVRMGAAGYLMMGPEHHRFHHSTEQDEAQNYSSVTALWDQVFGTFIYRPGEAPEEIGISEPHRFPESGNLLHSISSPFMK